MSLQPYIEAKNQKYSDKFRTAQQDNLDVAFHGNFQDNSSRKLFASAKTEIK